MKRRALLSRPFVLETQPARPLRLAAVLLLVLLAGCRAAGEVGWAQVGDVRVTSTVVPVPILDPQLVSLGEVVYAEKCAECHGENLEGEPEWKVRNADDSFRTPPHDASGHTWHHSDRVLREAILHGGARLDDFPGLGTSNMPAFAGTLSEDEVEAVLTYIKSTWPDDIRAIQWEQTVNDPAPESEN